MHKYSKGVFIQSSDGQDIIYIRQGEIYFIYRVEES